MAIDRYALARELKVLRARKDYYNNHRTHAALSGLSPAEFGQQANRGYVNINDYGWQQHCRGLFHTPIPA